ncbi:MAG TPA: carboxyl transferase domain-containing protein, partial [Chitinophagales bacterium]
ISGVVSPDIKVPYDCRELIARIIDDSDFTEFKPDYGTTLVTGWATIGGYKTGIIANNGVIFSDSANKGAHFIQLCNQNNVPILFLQNITGFMVGKKYEEEGIIKHGAKLINAVSNSETPTVTLIVGASYGAGNYAMNGLAYQPNLLFAYPNSKIAVMGGEQLAGVMEIVQREAAAKSGVAVDEDQLNVMKFMITSEAEKKSSPWFATGQTWDDGIINPAETRNYLKIAMCIIHNKRFKASGKFGVFRM